MTAATLTPVALDAAESANSGQIRMTKLMRALAERSQAGSASTSHKPMLALEALRALWRFLAALVRRLATRLGFRVAEAGEPTEQQLRGEAELDAQLVPSDRAGSTPQLAADAARSPTSDQAAAPLFPVAAPQAAAVAPATAAAPAHDSELAGSATAMEREVEAAPEVTASVAALAIEAELKRLVEHLLEQGVPENLIPAGGRDVADLEHHVRLLAQYRQVYRDNCKALEALLDERLQPLCAHVYPDIQPATKALELIKQDLMNKDARMMMYDKSGELAEQLHNISAMQVAVARVTESLSALHEACVGTKDPQAIEAAATVFARWAPDVLAANQVAKAQVDAGADAVQGVREGSAREGGSPVGEEFAIKYVAQSNHSVQNNLELNASKETASEPAVSVDDGVRKKAGMSAFAALARRGSSVPEPADWQLSHERPEAAV